MITPLTRLNTMVQLDAKDGMGRLNNDDNAHTTIE